MADRDENRSTCCGAPLRQVFVGKGITFYDCRQCGRRQQDATAIRTQKD